MLVAVALVITIATPPIAQEVPALAHHDPDLLEGEKSRATLQRRLHEHLEKLEDYRQVGGHTSSVEREIRNFESQIRVIDQVLGR